MVLGYLIQNWFDHSAYVFKQESKITEPIFEELEGLIEYG